MEKMFNHNKLIDCELCKLGFQTSNDACHCSLLFVCFCQESNSFQFFLTAEWFDRFKLIILSFERISNYYFHSLKSLLSSFYLWLLFENYLIVGYIPKLFSQAINETKGFIKTSMCLDFRIHLKLYLYFIVYSKEWNTASKDVPSWWWN